MRVRTEAKREAIVQAAASVFFEAGFSAASMSQIAARAGGSKRTLYGYFASKEELFLAVAHHEAEQFIGPIVAALASSDDDLSEALQHFGEKVLGVLCTPHSVRIWRTIIGFAGDSPISALFYDNGPQQAHREVARFLAERMRRGELRHADPAIASRHLAALLEAETLLPCLFGRLQAPSESYLRTATQRALQGFFSGYGPLP